MSGFFAATPLLVASVEAIGTLCVADDEPRRLSRADRSLVLHLGYAATHVIERHRRPRWLVDQSRRPAA